MPGVRKGIQVAKMEPRIYQIVNQLLARWRGVNNWIILYYYIIILSYYIIILLYYYHIIRHSSASVDVVRYVVTAR